MHIGVEALALRRGNRQHLVALQCREQLAQRGFAAFAQLLGRGTFDMKGRFEAVDHGQQVLGKAFDAEFARLGHIFFGAAAGVLHISLGAQVVVIELLDLGLQRLHVGGGRGFGLYFRLRSGRVGIDHVGFGIRSVFLVHGAVQEAGC